MQNSNFRTLKLKPETLERLQDLKLAFEMSYCEPMYNDAFVQKLIASVEDGEPAVWEYYCKIQTKREENRSGKQE